MAVALVGGFLAVFGAAAPAGAATESFSLSSASLPGQSSVGWQVGLGNPPATPNVWPDPITLNGQIDPTTGNISGATLSLPPMTQPPTEGETPTFTFTEVHPGTATGTYNSTTGAVALNDQFTLSFHIDPLGDTCISTPINVALSGTYDSTTQDVTLATTSSFTIPQFPSGSNCLAAVAAGINASPGGVAGSVGNSMSLALHGQFAPGLPTTTSLSVSPDNPVLAGTSVTLSATVTDPSGAGTPTGSVNFLDNGASVGTGMLSSGTASVTTSTLPGGTNEQLTAVYGGDPSYAGSTSSATSYTVNPVPSVTTALPSSLTVPTSSAAPTVTALSPGAGPPAGGTKVTINGTGFVAGATVTFGTTKATDVTVVNSSTITATAPAGTGTVDVTVTTPNGTSSTTGGTANPGSVNETFPAVPVATDLFSYGTPAVTAVTPNAGNSGFSGFVGPWVITGTNFVPGSTVQVGTYTVGSLSTFVNSPTQITLGVQALYVAGGGVGNGTWDVTVTTPNGTSPTSPNDQLTIGTSPLLVTAVSPTGGPAAGGTSVTLTGQGFTGATAVDFGTTPATSFTVTSDKKITATAPAGTAGKVVDVTVTTPSGTSGSWWADRFAYGAPTVTEVSPANSPAAGGTAVTITGTGFITGACTAVVGGACTGPTGGSTVEFDATAATNVNVVSPTEITATAPAGAGTVDVTVTSGAGTSATSLADQFTYGPTVTSVTPPSGATAGGTAVTIAGTGFTGATAVNFGATAATNVTIVNPTEITATSPKGTAGAVDVTVTTPAGISATAAADQFFYGAPTVTAITPNAGPLAGGTSVVIAGTGFTGASAVKIGSTTLSSSDFTVNSATQITATTPLGSAGVVHVTVTTPGGTSSASGTANEFTYSNAPSVSSVSPNSPTGSTTVITITGANFTGASSVSFGSTAATSFTVVSGTQITATAPSGTGTVDVAVASASGTSATWPGDQFAFGAPTVSSVTPNSGPLAGGTGVVIRGSGFATGATVNFGSVAATGTTVVSPTEITALSPAEGAGKVDVTVTTLGGTSATSGADTFTYSAAATTPAQFDLTITNPSTGQSWDNVYAEIVVAGISQPSSNLALSYQDSSGDWCPLTATGATGTFTYYLSGLGSSCGSPPASMSLSAGGSLVVPMQLSYASGTYLGTQSVTTTLYSGTCSSPTSCSQSGALNGQAVGTSSVNLVPVARLDTAITGGVVASAVHQSFYLKIPTTTVTATNKTTGVPTPTGTVSWLIDGSPVSVIPQSGGAAVSSVSLISNGSTGAGSYLYDTTDLAPGIHTLTVQYSGDGVYVPASLSQTFTVLPAPPGTQFTCNTGSAPFGGYVTVSTNPTSQTLSGTSAWLTNVAVTVDYDPSFAAAAGISYSPTTTFTLSPGGSATAVAPPIQSASATDNTLAFSGMSAFVPVTGSPGSNMAVSLVGSFSYIATPAAKPFACTAASGGAPVATIPVAGNTLGASPSGSSAPSAPVTLTDTVYPSPTTSASYGQVDFYDGSTDLGTVPVDTSGDAATGTATLTTNQLALGAHQLTAVWSGGGVPANTSNEVDYQVGSSSTTTLTSSANPANAAQPVTFTATVTPPSGSTAQPTGDVAFSEDGNPISSCASQPLSTASPPTATCALSIGAGQSHSIVSTYSGDGNFTGSASQPLTQTTLPGTTTTVFSTKDPSPPGKVTIWAGVSASSGGPTPTGTVAFSVDGKAYAPCSAQPLGAGGGVSCTVSFKAGTSHKVFATYAGSAIYSGSTSNTITQTVTGSSGSTKPKTTTATATLASGKTLSAGQSLSAGNYRLTMQSDGNLVEYQGSKARWASGTSGRPGTAVVMQKDGNLVEYQKGKAIWSTKTAGHEGAHLTLQGSDGNVVIYGPGGKALWATGT